MTDHVIDRLKQVVEARPTAIAIACAGEPALTYAALWHRAHGLASAIEPGEIVALHVEKSPELVVGMIATWIAGAAWVPVLPELPDVRRQWIVDETKPRVALVASDRTPAWLADRCRIVDLRQEMEASSSPPRSTEDRAYIIYTSGSTGQPKGVVVSHRGLVPMLDAQIVAFELDASAHCLWMLSPSFDASISDVGTALLAGATLHIEHPSRLRDGLLDTIRQRGITHVDLPPSLLPLLPAAQAPPSLRTIIVGGEVCAPAAIRAWAERVRVVNVYGPTEATVCTSLIQCTTAWERPLLGTVLPHVACSVEDGELWITGPGVATGYLERPALDAAKFVERDGRRWFRTGDRVRVHPDGLEFVGRIDRQLKIAGVLVAPEEIEARLREHPRVTDAHVVAEQLGTRERLVAYYGADEELPDLRAHLAQHLDARLLPARFVRAALASAGKRSDTGLSSEPATILSSVWERLLGVVPELDDDFFALGGDSLAAIEHVGLAELAGLAMTAEMLYEHRTINALVAALEHETRSSAMSCTELIVDVAELRETHRAVRRAARGSDRAIDREAIVLTGATGFLGSRVLVELVSRASVTCVVRDPSALLAALRDVVDGEHAIAAMSSHVRVIAGDLTLPQLGLSDALYDQLATTTSAIVHCAAAVSLAKPYRELRATNVEGTARVLELAALAGARVHHASTLSVFVGSDRAPSTLRETDELETAERLHGGYAQAKWAAEWLAREAGATIYRLGLLTGDTRTGRAAPRDWLTWFVRGLAKLGAMPRGLELAVDLTPVDHAASAISALVDGDARGTFHVANRRSATLTELAAAIRRAGISLDEVDEDWTSVVAAAHLDAPEATAAVLGLCRGTAHYARLRTCDVFQATGHAFDTSRTDAVASCPPPSAELLDRYVAAALEDR